MYESPLFLFLILSLVFYLHLICHGSFSHEFVCSREIFTCSRRRSCSINWKIRTWTICRFWNLSWFSPYFVTVGKFCNIFFASIHVPYFVRTLICKLSFLLLLERSSLLQLLLFCFIASPFLTAFLYFFLPYPLPLFFFQVYATHCFSLFSRLLLVECHQTAYSDQVLISVASATSDGLHSLTNHVVHSLSSLFRNGQCSPNESHVSRFLGGSPFLSEASCGTLSPIFFLLNFTFLFLFLSFIFPHPPILFSELWFGLGSVLSSEDKLLIVPVPGVESSYASIVIPCNVDRVRKSFFPFFSSSLRFLLSFFIFYFYFFIYWVTREKRKAKRGKIR